MLMGRVAKRVSDKRLLKLIRAFLNAGVMENGLVGPTEEGTQQGGPLSPLLSNLMLDDLDRELTKRNRGVSLERMVEQLSRYLIGWRGYFGFCQTPSVLQGLDSWIRRRLRCFQWKQWKRGKTRFAGLRRRGVGKDPAAQTAGSPHGPWRISRSPALSFALPGAYLDSLGLPRLSGARNV